MRRWQKQLGICSLRVQPVQALFHQWRKQLHLLEYGAGAGRPQHLGLDAKRDDHGRSGYEAGRLQSGILRDAPFLALYPARSRTSWHPRNVGRERACFPEPGRRPDRNRSEPVQRAKNAVAAGRERIHLLRAAGIIVPYVQNLIVFAKRVVNHSSLFCLMIFEERADLNFHASYKSKAATCPLLDRSLSRFAKITGLL